MTEAPFVTEVLLYDRLIIPVPDPKDRPWPKEWEPELLQHCLNILKVKKKDEDGLALTVPWDSSKRERFKNRMSMGSALATQQRDPEKTYYMDPFEMTRALIKDEFLPALPPGVSKAWTVAAYPSADAFRREVSISDPDRKTRLATLLSHRFFTPVGSDPKHEMLKRAVDLATTDDFRRKRRRFYEKQEEIIQEEISDEKAIEEFEQLLSDYDKAIQKAFHNAIAKYAFTVIPIGLSMTGAILAGKETGLVIAAASGLVQLTRFWKFDRKPAIADGDLDAAAMIHDARKVLSLD